MYVAKVKNVVLEVLAADAVRVSWDKLNLPGITKYHVYYRPKDETKKQPETEVQVPGNNTSVFINKTFDAGLYVFEVVAQQQVGGQNVVGLRSDMSIMLMLEEKLRKHKCKYKLLLSQI